MTIPNVQDYYNQNVQKEWLRLQKHSVNEIEFETTKRYIEKYLRKNDKILDIGGGPGRYSFWLAEKDYTVFLADYTSGLVEKAKKIHLRLPKRIKENIIGIKEADVRDLKDFETGQFNVTLCLGGVLSHLLDKKDQQRALKELSRVTSREGYIFISVIGLLAVLQSEIINKFVEEVAEEYYLEIAKKGDYDGLSGFTACHFYTADDLRRTIQKSGLEIIEIIGLEGFSSTLEKPLKVFKKNEKAWRNLQIVREYYEKHPSVVDMSEHILAICKSGK